MKPVIITFVISLVVGWLLLVGALIRPATAIEIEVADAPPALSITADVPTNTAFIASELLGRPTTDSITINIVPAAPLELYYEYGLTSGLYVTATAFQTATAAGPLETLVGPLQPNTRYYYRLRYRLAGGEFAVGDEHTFMTQRASGSSFTFDLQGDSHPERTNTQFNPELYARTLSNAAADQPDFYLTLGDDFSVDALVTTTAAAVTNLYVNQRQFLGQLGHSAAVFLVNGNHEQAAQVNLDGTPDNVAVWAQTARNAYYPQPAPDGFYTGDAQPVDFIGLLRDYYAWTWGDALFVVIDPYWHSPVAVDNVFGGGTNPRDPWDITLGEEQYQWFKQTLETSTAQYKFVFAHHVNGTGRGGIELADRYEWGGYDPKGNWKFDSYRPAWEQPLHQLMSHNGVTIFFQGHDHIFVKQELDGVVYLSLPEPANPFYSYENAAAYLTGDKLPNSGHVRVTVAPEGVTVNYVRAYRLQDENATQINGTVAYSCTIVPPVPPVTFPGALILGRPTDTTITANLLAEVDLNAYLTYGPQGSSDLTQTGGLSLSVGVPLSLTLAPLQPDTAYEYQVHFQRAGDLPFEAADRQTFHTQRAPGGIFTFTVEADPHNRDANFSGPLFNLTLQNALADRPDFLVDLGDTFMTEKVRSTTYLSVVQTMLDLRPYFGMFGPSAPVFLVNGNHEGELGWLLNDTPDNLAIWSTQARQLYYPNPVPDDFYSGSTTPEPFIGRRDGYYAWNWGDALLVVLDPFWYTLDKPKPDGDNWGWTLGKAQYDWFKQTLEHSSAKFKFVFAHQLVGGTNDQFGFGRGGIEWAQFYEWGGYNLDGSWGFDANRPGWGVPIHQLLVDNHVTIFFHGHDHLFVKQDLDGVVYQEVPQPSNRDYDAVASAADYGYVNGTILGNSGHVRVVVSPTDVTVAYVRAYLPQDETAQRQNGTVSYQYTLGARVYLPIIMRS